MWPEQGRQVSAEREANGTACDTRRSSTRPLRESQGPGKTQMGAWSCLWGRGCSVLGCATLSLALIGVLPWEGCPMAPGS